MWCSVRSQVQRGANAWRVVGCVGFVLQALEDRAQWASLDQPSEKRLGMYAIAHDMQSSGAAHGGIHEQGCVSCRVGLLEAYVHTLIGNDQGAVP
jgi:hypothetical protein